MGKMVNILDYDAVSDGSILTTEQIQQAIEDVYRSGGGSVIVPAGTYLISTLYIRSRIRFVLEEGAVLLAYDNLDVYPELHESLHKDIQPYHLLVIENAERVTICGGGAIDGQGERFWHPREQPNTWYVPKQRRISPLIEAYNSSDVRIVDITLRNAPGWTLHLRDCDRVHVRGVHILNDLYGPNTDGIDITGCRDVWVSDCQIVTGDDAIVLKTLPYSRTTERVAVTNCVLRTNCVALKLGAKETFKDMRHVTFSNCVVHQSHRAFGLYMLRGAVLEHITVTNIVCDTDTGIALNRPIHLDVRRHTDEDGHGTIRNVIISNFIASTNGRILMTAEEGSVLENVTLRDVMLTYSDVEDPSEAAERSRSDQFSNRTPEARAAKAAVVAECVSNLVMDNVSIVWPNEESTIPDGYQALWARRIQGGIVDASRLTQGNRAVQLIDSAVTVRQGEPGHER